ncbi:response regulator transcription factor [Schaalia sp. 19OD2882]|uniref:response regulator transcription factor n=1 Tax=Schaalia sp. 19OD2882 TaxID=2794089 RepID=UPI001C1EB9CD|nr:response regulator transcription factor [Schaalia sp. 19OD2882]QWW19067.1 response regulator transcription factor [Schaalia sp. 19OD2882]
MSQDPTVPRTPVLRLLIAEDVDLVAEAFEALLSVEPAFEVVGRVGRGDVVARTVLDLSADVVVMDIDMPGATGIEATSHVKQVAPDCKVLLLTALPGSGHVHRALAAGADGYLVKSTTGARLLDAIKKVAAGGTVIDPDLAADALRVGPCPLTDREVEILTPVSQGATTEETAGVLFLSAGTVRNYLSNAMTRLGVSTRMQAVSLATERGWL